MICNRTPTGWELFYQNAHGLVAMELLRPWRAAERPARWGEVLYAAAQHDNGWQEWEPGDHLTPIGTPRHFEETTPADVVRQSAMALGRVHHASLFAGLLLAEHFRSLYSGMDDAAVKAMLRAQAADRPRWRRALGVAQAEVEAAYAFLRWADTLSLFLCCRRMPPDGLRVEVGNVGGAAFFGWQRPEDGSVGLEPWPYEADAFEVRTEAYALRRLTFPSAERLAEAIARAKVEPVAWTLRRE